MDIVLRAIEDHSKITATLVDLSKTIQHVADKLLSCLKSGGTIYFCGNGGSAADSQHLAAELVGRFKRERHPLRAIALTTDTSVLTCVGNDYSFDDIFSRQIRALASPGDVLIAVSTSGNSSNILKAIHSANSLGVQTVALTGNDGGEMVKQAHTSLIVPSSNTARIQEMHILVGHILCELIDADTSII